MDIFFIPAGLRCCWKEKERNHLTKPEIYSFMDNLGKREKISLLPAWQGRQQKPNLLVSNLLQLWKGGKLCVVLCALR